MTTESNAIKKLSAKREILEILALWLLGGSFQEFFLEGGISDLSSFSFENVLVSGVFWVFLWKGTQYQVLILDRLGIGWIEDGVKRTIIAFFSIGIYVVLVVFSIYILKYVIFGELTLESLVSQLSLGSFLPALFITFGINAFMHGRAFWIEWRKAAKEREKYRIESANFKFQALKNQVNPHFLFNSLNVLSSLVYEDQDRAVEFIRKMSEVYRYVLESKDEELVDLKEEIAFIKSFIFLQKIRFGENLHFKIEGEGEGYLPPMSLQVLIENAIKHNVVSEAKPLTVYLELNKDFAAVRNNIQEKLSKDSTGIGLSNLKARYEFLSDQSVEILNDGKEFSVKLPLLKIKG